MKSIISLLSITGKWKTFCDKLNSIETPNDCYSTRLATIFPKQQCQTLSQKKTTLLATKIKCSAQINAHQLIPHKL